MSSKALVYCNGTPSVLDYDERLYDITLKQLLCHTAGFSSSFELGIDKKIYSNFCIYGSIFVAYPKIH